VLDLVIRFIVVNIIPLFTLLVVKLVYGLETLHGPICQLPRLAPPNVHRLRADYYHHKLDALVADARAQAWSSRWRDARLYSVNAALTQH